jgi:hypothetical protein
VFKFYLNDKNHMHTPQNIYIVTRSKILITMKISNITNLQPSTAPLLMSMHKKKKNHYYINIKFQKYPYKQKNK